MRQLEVEKQMNQGEVGRLRWQCRRGLLELDIILLSFLEKQYPALQSEKKLAFQRLLQEQDTVLQQWLFQSVVPEDDALAALVTAIRSM